MNLVCYSLSDGDDAWSADDRNRNDAVNQCVLSVAGENLDHDITGQSPVLGHCRWLLCGIVNTYLLPLLQTLNAA